MQWWGRRGAPLVLYGPTGLDEGVVAEVVVMLCSTGPGKWRCLAASFATRQSIAIQLPDSARMGPSGRSLSLKRKCPLFQLPQLSQRSV